MNKKEFCFINKYSRLPNITGVPNKSVGWIFFLKINKTGEDLKNEKSRMRPDKAVLSVRKQLT